MKNNGPAPQMKERKARSVDQEDNTLVKIANQSGFPLQIEVCRAVAASKDTHGFVVRYIEHAWSDAMDDGFIDVVLQKGNLNLVVECKRVPNTWVFLAKDGNPRDRTHAKAYVAEVVVDPAHYGAGERPHEYVNQGWQDVQADYSSPETAYCANGGQSSSDRSVQLERWSAALVQASESLAQEDLNHKPAQGKYLQAYLNVLVTTAELQIAHVQEGAISLKTGEIDPGRAKFTRVQHLRFRKQFSTRRVAFGPGAPRVDYQK